MIRGNRVGAGFVLALLVVGALSGAAAIADEGVDEGVQETEAPAGDVATASSSAQPQPEDQGSVEFDPESTAGACPGGTAMKVDNLRSNGVFGPVTVSDFTNTSFTWTSTQAVSAVLVKDGGGYNTNPGGSSGSASSLGQDISHVIFCLGAEVPEVDAEEPCDGDETMPGTQPCDEPCDADETMPGTQPCDEPCDGDETMPGTQPCEPELCDDDDTMPRTQPCEPEPCDGDDTMPGTQPCEPELCDGDGTMPGTQPCTPVPCDADDKMPGRQDCADVDVAGVQSDPEKPVVDDDVQGAGLAADREPDGGPIAQPMAAQPVPQGTVLPLTGAPLLSFVMIAFGLVTAGGGAVLIKRP